MRATVNKTYAIQQHILDAIRDRVPRQERSHFVNCACAAMLGLPEPTPVKRGPAKGSKREVMANAQG